MIEEELKERLLERIHVPLLAHLVLQNELGGNTRNRGIEL